MKDTGIVVEHEQTKQTKEMIHWDGKHYKSRGLITAQKKKTNDTNSIASHIPSSKFEVLTLYTYSNPWKKNNDGSSLVHSTLSPATSGTELWSSLDATKSDLK